MVEGSLASFRVERARLLADSGLGIGRDGLAGDGSPGQVASASIQAKLTAWSADRELYSEPSPIPGDAAD